METFHKEINEWVELYSQPLLNRTLSLVANKEDAMDIVQEVFVAALSARKSFEHKSSPLTWLQNILRNKVADFYRDRYRKPTTSMSDFFDETGSWIDNSVGSKWNVATDNSDEQQALVETLDKCLERLPNRWNITVRLYYIEEKKASEVCRELGINTTNLWKILQRSRMQLRKCLELNWFEKL